MRLTRVIRITTLLLACMALPARAQSDGADTPPEAATGRVTKHLVTAKRHMVVAADPLAAEAGRAMLRAGGNALDAAIAVQMVLNMVEPQSSGIGGGGFLIHYDAKTRRMAAWDGRETAPAAATPERFLVDGKPLRFGDAVASGLSVGVPGVLAMLEAAHRAHGRLPWQALFAPALRLADDGFPVSQRLAELIASDTLLSKNTAARALFHHPDGTPLRAGETLNNPELGRVLRTISREGAKAFYQGDIAADIVAAVHAHMRPGDMTVQDIAAYQPRRREVLCSVYRTQHICGMPPPSSGTATIAMMLAMLERFPLAKMKPGSPGGSMIINYVAKTLVGLIDWKLDAQQAADLPNFGSRNRTTELEAGTAAEDLAPQLRARGHAVRVLPMSSGVHVIAITPGKGLSGGADPRREGVALGD